MTDQRSTRAPVFSDGAVLLDILLGMADGDMSQLYDLSKLKSGMVEIERKYYLPETPNRTADEAVVRFLGAFGAAFASDHVTIERCVPFVGIDQYFLMYKQDDTFTFRYRLGANRRPQLTVKLRTGGDPHECRGEINLDVSNVHPETVRAFMAVVCRVAERYQNFFVQQSGMLCIVHDASFRKNVEVVVYKVHRSQPREKTLAFVEIEPYEPDNVTQALSIIEFYEKELKLDGHECHESVAELFCP